MTIVACKKLLPLIRCSSCLLTASGTRRTAEDVLPSWNDDADEEVVLMV